MAEEQYDLALVGSGPGGYVAAIRAAQLGLGVAIVEEDRPGGVCLNWGCIPTKALLRNAEILSLFRRAEEFGITVQGLTADYAQAIRRSRRVADRLSKGVEFLFKKNKITLIRGRGSLIGPTALQVGNGAEAQTVKAKAVILATGSEPKSLPSVPIDGQRIITSNDALRLETTPKSLLIIGAGAVGVEFADIYAAYGVQVTLLEALDRILPVEDEEISTLLTKSFTKRGIALRMGTKVLSAAPGPTGVVVEVEGGGKKEKLTADQVLVAVGRGAKIKGLGLEALGVALNNGFVKVDGRQATSVPGLYAIGDLVGPPLLAHKAMAEGVRAAEVIAGKEHHPPVDLALVPNCTYCQPQVASLGLTEAQARAKGLPVKIGRFPFQASGKALALGEPEGMIKVVAHGETGEILGAHIIGAEATELIAEFGLGKTLEATVEELALTMHAHPTLAEASLEASLGALGRAIHL